MIPPKTDIKWKAIITGEIKHDFKCLPAGMMIARYRREFAKENSIEKLNKLIDETYSFFQKFEEVLTDDTSVLFK